jgi:peptide/nickel transport system substrate-binding protein
VDGTNLLDQTVGDQIKAAGYSLVPHELDWSGLILFDRAGQLAPQLADVRVRQAINYAIDRKAMLKAVVAGNGTVTGQVFNPNVDGYDKSLDNTYDFDPDKAKKLMADAGYASGFTLQMPQVQIGSNTVYDLLRQYLGDIGITVQYTQIPLQSAISDILSAKYPAAFFILQMDPTSWQTANFSMTQSATWNVFHQPDTTVEQLTKTIQTGSEQDAANAAQQLNKYVVDQAWFDPWYRLKSSYATGPNIDVVQQSDNAYPYLWNITPKS